MSSETIEYIFYPFFLVVVTAPVWCLVWFCFTMWQFFTDAPMSEGSIDAMITEALPTAVPVSISRRKGSKRDAPTLSEYDEKYKLPDTLFED